MGSIILPVLFLLPLLTYARIHIDMDMNRQDPENSIRISGNSHETVTEQDVREFNLNDEKLKEAIKMSFGEMPDEVYTKSPTPYGDLYRIFEWNQVSKMIRPIRAKMLSITAQPEVIATKIFENKKSVEVQYEIPDSFTVENEVKSQWVMKTNMTVDESILYSFNVKSSSMNNKNVMKYVRHLGSNMMDLKAVSISSKSKMMMSLRPKQMVVMEMYANRETLSVQIDYETKLMGSVAMSYNNGFKGHMFWSADVNMLMRTMDVNMPHISEMVEIIYYTEPRVVIRDFATSEVLYSIPLVM